MISLTHLRPVLAAFVGLATAGGIVLVASGALRSALTGHPDETAHYVSGLMVYRYLRDALGEDPFRFAQEYYLHYPKVAIGHWPPVFPAALACWMLVAGTSVAAALVLQVLLSAATGAVLFAALRRRTGIWLGCAAAGCWMLFQQSQRAYTTVMAEPLLALLGFLAALGVARYLESGRSGPLLQYAVASTLAVLTKGSGLALLGLPVFAALLARHPGSLRDWRIHAAPAAVAAVTAPWNLLTLPMVRNGFDPRGVSLEVIAEQGAAAVRSFVPVLGLGLAVPVLAGVALFLAGSRAGRRLPDPFWGSALALTLVTYGIHIVSPTFIEPRRVVGVLPALIAMAALAADRFASRIRMPGWAAAAGLTGLVMLTGGGLARKGGAAWREFVRDELAPALRPGSAVLIAGQEAENAIIGEMAQREPRPSVYLVRASKFVADSDWTGADYRLRLTGPDALEEALRAVPVNLVVVERDPPFGRVAERERPHVALVRELVRRPDGPWRLAGPVAADTGPAPGSPAELYERRPPLEGEVRLTVDLRRMLGRSISTDDRRRTDR